MHYKTSSFNNIRLIYQVPLLYNQLQNFTHNMVQLYSQGCYTFGEITMKCSTVFSFYNLYAIHDFPIQMPRYIDFLLKELHIPLQRPQKRVIFKQFPFGQCVIFILRSPQNFYRLQRQTKNVHQSKQELQNNANMERLNSGLTSILLEGMEPSFCRASFKSLPPLIAGSLCTPSAATKMVTCRNSLHHNGKKNSHFYSVKNNYDYQTGDDFAFLKFRERHRYIIVIYIPTTDLV